MPETRIATVTWGSVNSPASLYGSALTLETSGAVRLVNRLVPSGTTLQEWYSSTDYQAVRDAPALPLLRHGQAYRLDPVLDPDPPDSLIFDVSYFDRFDDLIGVEVLYPPSYGFRYPADCHHYTIRLLNGGCDEFRFSSFALLEVDDGH